MKLPVRLFGLFVGLMLLVRPVAVKAQQPIPEKGNQSQLKAFLKSIPPQEPADVLKTFEILKGYRLDLVAHEPLVNDPVAATFDEDGRLYVAELRDYPYRQPDGSPPLGRIRLLEDTDGDGKYDRSHVFADELMWPTGIAVWKQGIFVAATPDIWYLKDTDGDHRADIRRKVFSGFGTEKAQGSLNNLTWGIDHKIYGAGSKNGGEVRPADDHQAKPLSLGRKDFRFAPNSSKLESLSGGAQFGNSFDNWYNRFLCSQAHPVHHVVLPDEYLRRNPYLPVSSGVNNLRRGVTPIFRISPLEPWRIIRSSRRVALGERTAASAGANHHILDGCAGSTVYRGAVLPAESHGALFVGGAQTNLIHRLRLVPDGVTFKPQRVDKETEIVRSTDTWFRPVNFVNAPDGTLYALDLYREVLEAVHIPHDVVAHLDLTSGRDRGRIYRIATANFKPVAAPRLSQATVKQLVAHLENPNSWWRETAQRLIYERQDRSAVRPLRGLLKESKFPQARLHALWSLAGLKSLREDDLLAALSDQHAAIREHAIRLAEPQLAGSPLVRDRLLAMVDETEMRIRFQLAFSLGAITEEVALEGLAAIARQDSADRWMRAAVLSSVSGRSHQLLALLLKRPDEVSSGLVQQLAQVTGVRNRQEEIDAVLEAAVHVKRSSWQRVIVSGLAAGLARHDIRWPEFAPQASRAVQTMLRKLVEEAVQAAGDNKLTTSQRRQAIEFLGSASFAVARPVLPQLLATQQPSDVQLAAARALSTFDEQGIADIFVDHWASATPALRAEILNGMFRRTSRIRFLLAAIDNKAIRATDIDSSYQEQLRTHRDQVIRDRAVKLFVPPAARLAVLKRYQASLALTGAAAAGRKTYERVCMTCHRLGDQGKAVGPNLAFTKNKQPAELLTHILDPNREVEPSFVQYNVVDRQGRIYTGMIATETASSITIRRAEAATDTILRVDIEEVINSGKSVMPEGLEQKVSLQQMADLLSYLRQIQYDLGTEAGLVEEPQKRSPAAKPGQPPK